MFVLLSNSIHLVVKLTYNNLSGFRLKYVKRMLNLITNFLTVYSIRFVSVLFIFILIKYLFLYLLFIIYSRFLFIIAIYCWLKYE